MYRKKRSKNSKKTTRRRDKDTYSKRKESKYNKRKAVLIHIAEIEKDIPTIRHYAKEIALEDKGNIEYYEKWKNTYPEKQW